MNVQQLVDTITPEAFQRIVYAVETGKWPEGNALSPEQRESCIQAMMLYQSKHNKQPEHMTVAAGGELHIKSKNEFKQSFSNAGDEILRVNPNDSE
ncbi:YeaC family protein [Vibrio sp. WJH972]